LFGVKLNNASDSSDFRNEVTNGLYRIRNNNPKVPNPNPSLLAR